MSLIVQKYGGSSLANSDLIRNVAKRISNASEGDNQVVATVSAMGDSTDNLMDIAAREIYYKHFGDSVHRYLSKKRRPSSKVSKGKRQDEILFSFIHKYQCELKVMFAAKDFIK